MTLPILAGREENKIELASFPALEPEAPTIKDAVDFPIAVNSSR
jgi:hypothetical protein